MERFSVVFIVVGLSVMIALNFIAMIVYTIFRTRPSRRVAEYVEEEGGAAAGLSTEEVSELPCHEFKQDGADSSDECAMCLEALRVGDRCTVLPRCGRVFHADCVGSWLNKSCRSPMCHAEVVDQRKDAAGATVVIVAED